MRYNQRVAKSSKQATMGTSVCVAMFLIIISMSLSAQDVAMQHSAQERVRSTIHRFFDHTNMRLQFINLASETTALLAIQSHDHGGEMSPCKTTPCTGALEARGRTLDPFEKHFESYGYEWGAAYRYGGGVALNLAVAYAFHRTGHHKLERCVPVIAIMHAQASTGYALSGSRQGATGW